ncbi:dTDP-4-dehydrorhamnose 3,5-epimerase [Mongoliibacter ruber]|uniref:dTDP-4-dehydrorhamnose 3,5-epimerase n=1 Tax=Mongoliibacter ruber TaxID=1750599 RepID=A0A2T0WH36_9BACT|nr:dTDP-4-dehydrorhamnose 3,5-epimerase [Mongoliibacter ruber]PRY86019.1 dTDP-4-dehydrorhamnose 3,5-epimerase [Mongoliibacter ruber]
MKIIESPIKGVFEIYPKIWEDTRGYFFESYRSDYLRDNGIDPEWLQENQSFSKAGTVRGLHFQRQPYGQCKLVRVLTGRVLDVAVDLRKGSPTFGKAFIVELNAKKHNMLYIPTDFAHGFSVLEDAVFSYKCSNYYNKESEGGILWNDPELGIDWGVDSPILSEKDEKWPTLSEFKEKSGGGL